MISSFLIVMIVRSACKRTTVLTILMQLLNQQTPEEVIPQSSTLEEPVAETASKRKTQGEGALNTLDITVAGECNMEKNHKLALIVAYYLSRFYVDEKDRTPLENIEIYTGITRAFDEIGKRLNVKPKTIKNMRDHFDPLHGHRKGWHQDTLGPSKLEVYEKFKDLSEEALVAIVRDIIDVNGYKDEIKQNIDIYTETIDTDDDDEHKSKKKFGTRGITGKKAEEIFLNKYNAGEINGLNSSIIDCRDNGCGYDFEVDVKPKIVFEVKGLAGSKGGVSFTDKEWSVAKKLRDNFNLVLVSNVNDEPLIRIIKDPYKHLTAKKRVTKTIAISWSVDEV
ncbi:DUF3883 domain-containing protein [Terribacillus saccharophilus]|uniref:DUF3883 domain-containing protein n=1 Tax=Terribacillus saccharophilus TaxID=361277 RepID=UPI001482447A|nr:DUF3883 domain-containing protein [Terribacillus saccharophilus]